MRTFVFSNHFEAIVAAAELRNDGYAVEVYDESVAALWGPMSVGGVRLAVEPILGIESTEGVEGIEASDHPVDNVLRWVFASILVCGGLSLLFGLLFDAASNPARMLMFLLVTALLMVAYVGAVSLIAEFTKGLVTRPLVLGVSVFVLLITKLLIG